MNTLSDLAQAVGGRIVSGQDCNRPIGRIVTDSRRVEPGDLFWALVGPNHDGANYSAEAIRRGASAIVTYRTVGGSVGATVDCGCVLVECPQRALIDWAKALRQQFCGPVVAITGSVGKTTTRNMIDCVLRSKYNGVVSPKNYNNRIGLPLSMTPLASSHDYAVLELGANAVGEIAELATIARPTIGVITSVADAHLGGFGSYENILKAKCELIDALSPSAPIVLPDDPRLIRQAVQRGLKVTTVGQGDSCDLRAEAVRLLDDQLTFRCLGETFEIPVTGRHFTNAALSAIAVGCMMGIGLSDIQEALKQFQTVAMRCRVRRLANGITIIDDSYNASPTSMRAAIDLLNELGGKAKGRKIALLGEMMELGPQSARLHYLLGKYWADRARPDDRMIATGQYAAEVARAGQKKEHNSMHCSFEQMINTVSDLIRPGDTILIKGSRGMRMERIVEHLMTNWDKEVSAESEQLSACTT